MTSTIATAAEAADIGWGIAQASDDDLTLERVHEGSLGGFKASSDIALCLLPLLRALNAEASPRAIAEALPHFANDLDLTDMLNVMANLGWESRSLGLRLGTLDPRLTPGLLLTEGGPAMVVLGRDGAMARVYDPARRAEVDIPAAGVHGRYYVFRDTERTEGARQEKGYFGRLVNRFRALILRTLGATLASNLVMLSTPLFIMSLYDKVIPNGALDTLAIMLLGIVVALAGDWTLKALRAKMIAHLGGRLDYILGRAVFQRVLSLPPAFTEMANISSQVSRLKDFETIREFFTGPVAAVLFELPFASIFLLMMAILGGPIVFAPAGAMVLFFVIALIMRPHLKRQVAASARTGSRRHEFLVEIFSKVRDIKDTGTEALWRERFRELSAEAVMTSQAATRTTAILGVLSQGLIVAAGLTTLGWGVLRVLDGNMTVGALIASMIMVWWVLKPLGVVFSALTQVARVRDSVGQIDRLMQVAPEWQEGNTTPLGKRFAGKLTLAQVSLRYLADQDPAIAGLTLQVEPGEVVAFAGPNGCGKTTILKMVMGMYRPQAGTVRIDDVDIRQIDPLALRQAIAYVPQQCEMFFGTIAQNLRLAHPAATDRELRWACEEAGLLADIEALPRGFETRVGDGHTGSLPSHFMQRLSLARAYLKRAPITLFDEPANGLDFTGDQQFMKVLQRMRGHSTVLLVSHRPSHLKLADRVAILQQGQLRMLGAPEQVLGRLPPGMF
jgi:ATP-binding cassette subfamily C protein/ATP-binding cassette subfamily C protein LapB